MQEFERKKKVILYKLNALTDFKLIWYSLPWKGAFKN